MANRLTRDTVAEEPREAWRLEGWELKAALMRVRYRMDSVEKY
jgi:hypothetical protein